MNISVTFATAFVLVGVAKCTSCSIECLLHKKWVNFFKHLFTNATLPERYSKLVFQKLTH